MGKTRNDYLDYILQDVLGHIEGLHHRAMFGGVGIYKDGVIFGLIYDNQLYFKVNNANRSRYESAHIHLLMIATASKCNCRIGQYLSQ